MPGLDVGKDQEYLLCLLHDHERVRKMTNLMKSKVNVLLKSGPFLDLS